MVFVDCLAIAIALYGCLCLLHGWFVGYGAGVYPPATFYLALALVCFQTSGFWCVLRVLWSLHAGR